MFAFPVYAWDFVVLSDTHLLYTATDGPYGLRAANVTMPRAFIADIRTLAPDMVFITGDTVDGDCVYMDYGDQLDDFLTEISGFYTDGIDVYAVRGNHNYLPDTSGSVWQTKWSGTYVLPTNGPTGEDKLTYSVSNSDAIFLCVDNFANGYETVNQNWVNSTIQANPNKLVFVFGHEPMFETFDHPYSTLASYPQRRNVFWEIMQMRKGSIYFCGHLHELCLLQVGNSYQCMTGSAYYSLLGTHGYTGTLNDPYTTSIKQEYYEDIVDRHGSFGYTHVNVVDDTTHYDITITYHHYSYAGGTWSTETPYSYAVNKSDLTPAKEISSGYSGTASWH